MSEPRRRSNFSGSSSSGGGSGGSGGLHRTNTLVREGIVPQRTSGLLNEAPISPKTSTKLEERRSRIVSDDGSARKPRSRSSADPGASPIPFAFTRSLGSSWYQVSAPDSGNATLRGGNHSGNGCLALRAGSARHFMLVHFNLHALNANLASYDLRFQANWDGADEQLHVVLCFRAADDFCVLSLRPQRGAALLRHCRTSPSDDPAALANATLLGEFAFEPMALAQGENVVCTTRLSPASLLCTLQRAPAASPTSSSAPPAAGASPPTLPGDVATVFDGPPPASGDLSRGCVAGVLVTCASRLSVRDWTVRLRYAAPSSSVASAATPGAAATPAAPSPMPLGLAVAQRPPATPTQRPSAPTLQPAQRGGPPATLRPTLRPGATVATPTTPAPAATATVAGPAAADVAALPSHVRDALGPERAARLAALPFDRDIVAAILADLLLPQSFQRVSFEEIAGLEEAKRLLSEAVVLPALLPSLFAGSALRLPWRGILLFGPPGTGKTLLARAVASLLTTLPGAQTGGAAVGGAFFSCSAATLVSKWRGDSEKLVKCLFSVARCVAPSVVFLDEVDALVSQRGGGGEHEASRRMKTEFFAQMDGVLSGDADTRVVVLATTNCPWDLDAAVLRRFEKRIYVPLPDAQAREAHFALCLRQLRARDPTAEDDDETRRWAARLAVESQGFSSADIVAACREAAMTPLRRLLAQHSLQDLAQALATQPAAAQPAAAEVTPADVSEALRRVRQSVPQASLARFDAWNELYGSALAPSAPPL